MFKAVSLSVIVLSGIICTASAQTLRLRADQWMPVNGDPASDRPGYFIEIAHAVFDHEGIVIDYSVAPWTEDLKAVNEGAIDGVIGANTVEAKDLILPTESIGSPRMGLFVLASDTWKYASEPSLAGRKIGCIESYSYWPFLDKYILKHPGQITLQSGDDALKKNIKILVEKQIDVIAESIPVFVWAAKESGHALSEFRITYTEPSEPIFVALSPKYPHAPTVAAIFDRGIRELRASGGLKKILDRYGMDDWK